ncbi:MAG: cobaltochelatase subunit, magnesium chelatase subunit D [Deltaproteobacteria bacterium CSP1-8]|nr:MAG: cobaltochelatase subunit, magnesium chelatase subunit D [Deltaproteobacteria bacterium CSP1-8]
MRLFPFSAIVGQELLKKGLLVNAVDPSIGGVLIRGEKGTGKTTAVRAFAAVLPAKETVSGCRFGCLRGVPPCGECQSREAQGESLAYEERPVEVVDLPLNASEDRVVGSLDLEAALREGSKKFEMGVLGKANGNLLYIDEVNLLDDHVVDVLLDVAVSGRNVVMREGVTYSHPSRFILVGTMNPEEGELRPQLLDRFGLCVEIAGEKEIALRKQIVDRVLSFESEEPGFLTQWGKGDRRILRQVEEGRARLHDVPIPDHILKTVTEAVAALGVAGHRGDIAILKTARALAVLRGGTGLSAADLSDAIRLALPHRIPRSGVGDRAARHVERLLSWAFPGEMKEEDREPVVPLPDTTHGMKRAGVVFRAPVHSDEELERQAIEQATAARRRSERGAGAGGSSSSTCGDPDCDLCQGFVEENIIAPSAPYQVRKIVVPKGRKMLDAPGKRSRARTASVRGRYVRSGPWKKGRDVAMDATLFTAVANGHVERSTGRIRVAVEDLRGKRRERKVGNLILVLLDASASMETQKRMVATKGAVLSLLRDAYVKRDRVGLISFRDTVAEVVVSPTGSASMAAMQLTWLASGGTTPLSIGMFAAVRTLEVEQVRDPGRKPLLVLITDGRANVAYVGGEPLEEAVRMGKILRRMGVTSLVIDTDRMMMGPAALRASMEATEKTKKTRGIFSGGPAKTVADAMGAKYLSLAEMSQSAILAAIRARAII